MLKEWKKKLPVVKQFQYKWILTIAVTWTIIDLLRFFLFVWIKKETEFTFIPLTFWLVTFRFLLVFVFSALMGYLIVIKLKKLFRNVPLWMGIILRTLVLYCIEFMMYSILFFAVYLFIHGMSFEESSSEYIRFFFYEYFILNNMATWVLLFIITQLVVEINEKYSPGLFRDILSGKYIEPKEENKIIMFIDLKNSTVIAEELGHKVYFRFIKDFIFHVSKAILKWDADIYQYVGDEVVLSWPAIPENYNKSIMALLEVRKELQKETDHYRTKYATIPDFRAGIHSGEVMIGEIGIVKKDLAMSGDSMNTAARIKEMVTDLNKRFIASKDFVQAAGLKDFQVESAGMIELKKKESAMELFILLI